MAERDPRITAGAKELHRSQKKLRYLQGVVSGDSIKLYRQALQFERNIEVNIRDTLNLFGAFGLIDLYSGIGADVKRDIAVMVTAGVIGGINMIATERENLFTRRIGEAEYFEKLDMPTTAYRTPTIRESVRDIFVRPKPF